MFDPETFKDLRLPIPGELLFWLTVVAGTGIWGYAMWRLFL